MPRISGNLYNCALNCALPNLLEQIELIATENEQRPHQESYELLKSKFEHWYGVHQISWDNFNQLLNHKLSFNEVELVLAPVLRLFIAEKSPAEANLRNVCDIIEYEEQGIDPEISEFVPKNVPGRYLSLTSHAANDLFYKYFGLQMVVSEFDEQRQTYVLENPRPIDGFHVIHAFLKFSHFELTPHDNLEEATYRNEDIFSIKERISSGASAFNTNHALADLIPLVSSHIQEIESNQVIKNKHQLLSPMEYIEHVGRFKVHHDSIESKLTYAVILLTLMQNFKETKYYAYSKLTTPYHLTQVTEIEGLLEETKAKAAEASTMFTSVSEKKEPALEEEGEKRISIDDFNAILDTYKTSYWFLNLFIQLLSFGYYKHESNTIKALKELSHKQTPVSNKMIEEVLQQDNRDSQQQRRLTFWQSSALHLSISGTDRVLSQLKNKFV